MPRITLSIPDKLKKRLDKHPEVNWAEIFSSAIRKRVEQLKRFEELVQRGEI